jgi:transcription antitermination factor NusG
LTKAPTIYYIPMALFILIYTKAYWDLRGEAVPALYQAQPARRQKEATSLTNDSQWYALRTHSRHEKQVRDRLLSIGIEPLLPLIKHCRQWSDRKVWKTLPLFTGYCFARFALTESLSVLKTPGIIHIVGVLKPEPIHSDEIVALQKVSSTDRMMEPCDHFTDGAWVEVVQGPLAGLRGQLVRRAKQDRLVIRVSLIQQAALIHIKADEVAAIQ